MNLPQVNLPCPFHHHRACYSQQSMGVYSKVMHMLLQAAPHSEEIILSVRKNNVNNCFIYLFILVAQSCAAFSVFSFFSKNIQHLGMSHINYFEEEYTL